jgi:tetratricopeptide (TPR) repeat protein
MGESSDIFHINGAMTLYGEYAFLEKPTIFIHGGIRYGLAPIKIEPVQTLSLLAGSIGVGFCFDLIPRFSLKPFASGGYYYGLLNDPDSYTGQGPTGGGSLLIETGVGFNLLLGPALDIDLGISYQNYLGLFQGLQVQLGCSLYLKGVGNRKQLIQSTAPARPDLLREARFAEPGEGVRINEIVLNPIFPVFHKFYDDHPIGQVVLINQEEEPITDLSLTLLINKYMDTPKECLISPEMKAKERKTFDLFALFTDDVLGITEGTKVAAEISLLYRMNGQWYQDTRTETVRIYDRNAMTWDDNRKASAFVTAKDPAGDCDDLSILYCALLESVGIETAFITVPGHILMAFSLGITEAEARKNFLKTEDLIYFHDTVWVPVEVTEREGGFLKAWEIAANSWRKYQAIDQTGFFPMSEAWELYEPVGLPGEAGELEIPSQEHVVSAFLEEVMRFVDREIFPRVVQLENEIKRSGGSPALRNRLGILYVKYGLVDKANQEFQTILNSMEYVPALVNLGNIHYLNEEWDLSLHYYERAHRRSPSNPTVLLSIARAHYQLEEYRNARGTYAKLKEVDSRLAEKYAYLEMSSTSDEGRAGDMTGIKGSVIWEEE